MSIRFERAYGLILSTKYNRIKIASLVHLLTLQPLYIYFVTLNAVITAILISFYFLCSLTLYAAIRCFADKFGRSKVARSLSISSSSLGSVIDLILSLSLGKLVLYVGALPFTVIFTVVTCITSFDRRGIRKVFGLTSYPVALIPSQAVSSMLVVALPMRFLLTIDAAFILTSLLTSYAVVKMMVRRGGVETLRLLKGLLASIAGSSGELEESLRALSTRGQVEMHFVVIRTMENKDVLILVPYVHTGPVGSMSNASLMRRLVGSIRSRCGDMLIDIIYMHGVGSHELDVIGRESVEKLVHAVSNEVAKVLMTCRSAMMACSSPRSIRVGTIDATHVPLGAVDLLVVSRHGKACDDIPLDVYKRALVDASADCKVVLVDAQNSYDDDNTWSDDDVKHLREVVREVCRLSGDRRTELIGIRLRGISISSPSVGPQGAKMLELTYGDGKRALLVVVDANNMMRELRESIRSKLMRYYDVVEILTTDNHELVSFVGSKGYVVLGERKRDRDLVDRIVDEVKAMMRDRMHYVKSVAYGKVETTVSVLGAEGFRRLSAIVFEHVRSAWKFALLIMVAPLVVLLASVAILCLI